MIKIKYIIVFLMLIIPISVMVSLIYFDPLHIIIKNQNNSKSSAISNFENNPLVNESTNNIKEVLNDFTDIKKVTNQLNNLVDQNTEPKNLPIAKNADNSNQKITLYVDSYDIIKQSQKGLKIETLEEIKNAPTKSDLNGLKTYLLLDSQEFTDNLKKLYQSPLISFADPFFGKIYNETQVLYIGYQGKIYFPGKSITWIDSFTKDNQEYWVALAIGQGGASKIIFAKPLLSYAVVLPDLQAESVISLEKTEKIGLYTATTVNGNGLYTKEMKHNLNFNLLINDPNTKSILSN